jgi:AcrR family transcriptional regulator
VRAACAKATVDGLDGISLAALAAELGVSKSGVFAHFGSKEELQLATIEEARQRFIREVIAPAAAAPSPLARLWRLCLLRLRHMRSAYPGGCFFGTANAAYDARGGPVHDRLSAERRGWLDTLAGAARDAVTARQLAPGTDAQVLARQLDALAVTASGDATMFADEAVFEQAAHTSLAILRGAAVDPDPDLPRRARVATRHRAN